MSTFIVVSPEFHSWIIRNIWCCENFTSFYVWSPLTFLSSFIAFEWFLGLFCWNLSKPEYIWNIINVKWIVRFCPWKENIIFNYLRNTNTVLNTNFVAERRNCRRNSCSRKLQWLTSYKMSTTYLCVVYFLSRLFFSPHSSDPFYSSLRISFRWWYTVKL